MENTVFKRVDIGFLADAYAEDATHADMNRFEYSLGAETDQAHTKAVRALDLLKELVARPDANDSVLQLLNHLYVDRSFDNKRSLAFRTLSRKVLEPRGIVLTDDGFVLDEEHVAKPATTPKPTPPVPAIPLEENRAWGAGQPEPPQLVDEWTRSDLPQKQVQPQPAAVQPSLVFIVHGRDLAPLRVTRQFLQFLGLHSMTWADATARTGKSQPTTYEIVRTGIEVAGAVIVIFSPDDQAKVQNHLAQPGESLAPMGQARQNVTLEAGMAFATAPHKTIFLRSGLTREISDIAGFNWVALDGHYENRLDLKTRLKNAGAAVRAGDYNLADELAGPFRVE